MTNTQTHRRREDPGSTTATITPIAVSISPLIGAKEASRYLGFKPITILRMARAGKLPCIAFPVGKTGKYIYKFRLRELETYVESLSRPAAA